MTQLRLAVVGLELLFREDKFSIWYAVDLRRHIKRIDGQCPRNLDWLVLILAVKHDPTAKTANTLFSGFIQDGMRPEYCDSCRLIGDGIRIEPGNSLTKVERGATGNQTKQNHRDGDWSRSLLTSKRRAICDFAICRPGFDAERTM